MGTPDLGGWVPPEEAAPAPAEAVAPAPVEVPVSAEAAAPVEVPPLPTAEVTTGPVAEAPAEAAPVVADTGVSNATPAVVADPTSSGTTDGPVVSATPSGDGGPEAPLDAPVPVVQPASNGPTTTAEQSLRTEAAKAYHLIGHLISVAHEVQGKIERFVPPEVLAAGEQEALALLRELI